MEFENYLRFVFALLFVLALIALAAWAARRFGLAGAMPVVRGRQKRLAVVESLALDAKRRLVLVRRDGVEHLLLLGAQSDVVVERQVPATGPPASGPMAGPDDAVDTEAANAGDAGEPR
ncbi:MAG: hypothetical protein GVY13_09440 [Alphaproteobacteria bacterium]|jgi:flagellar protein FliO/FliZ|nr:hypothetical protein [Alphaproteobacteria bacterium]